MRPSLLPRRSHLRGLSRLSSPDRRPRSATLLAPALALPLPRPPPSTSDPSFGPADDPIAWSTLRPTSPSRVRPSPTRLVRRSPRASRSPRPLLRPPRRRRPRASSRSSPVKASRRRRSRAVPFRRVTPRRHLPLPSRARRVSRLTRSLLQL